MKLYIGNLTRQRVEFAYRVIGEAGGIRMQAIQIGRQIQVAGDLNQPQIDAIVEHHSKYGMIPVADIKRNKHFAGLCYSIDRPISADNIMLGLDLNIGVLVERGKAMRQEAAVAAHNNIEQHMDETQIGNLQDFKVTVEQEERKGGAGEFDAPPVAEATRVTRRDNPDAPRDEPRRRIGKRKAAA